MQIEYHSYGAIVTEPVALPMTKATLDACEKSNDFDIVECRVLKKSDNKTKEIIVVDCINDAVASHNQVGIKKRERIALIFSPITGEEPQVRALRMDFPSSPMHMYSVPPGEPPHLCLYNAPWSEIERSWTPQLFLKQILFWFSGTADGTLHKEDQPVEQMYYNSPFKIVLPPDFLEKSRDDSFRLILEAVLTSHNSFHTVCGRFIYKNDSKNHNIPKTRVLFLDMPPVVHERPATYQLTLGKTHDQLETRGIELLDKLNECIGDLASPNGILKKVGERCLIIMSFPLKRSGELTPERCETNALMIDIDLASLGLKTGVLSLHETKYYAVPQIGTNEKATSEDWRDIPATPIEIRNKPDSFDAQKMSGVQRESASFRGAIAGVGALGSVLTDLWSREAWGAWTIIDHDTIEPHNLVRHIAKDFCIGLPKVDAVKLMVEQNYHDGFYHVDTIQDRADNFDNPKIMDALTKSSLIIDSTTTLAFPRDIALRDDVPRCVSVFLSPSGLNSVLLLESSDRTTRLDSLEAQYYRAIINNDWGEIHLSGHAGKIRVGAGCRDISTIISNESVLLHAANLARQIRFLHDHKEPCIRIWASDNDTGELKFNKIIVQNTLCINRTGWEISFDEGVRQKLFNLRQKELPNETGGIILGYIDQKIKKIYVVDVFDAPPDSQRHPDWFERGTQGLVDMLSEIKQRTAYIVDYIGDWHSHPDKIPARPSQDDKKLISELAETLSLDGQPALMIIVGKNDIHFSVKENHG